MARLVGTEIKLKPEQVLKRTKVVMVRPKGWFARTGDHQRHLSRPEPIEEITAWMRENIRGKWQFQKKTKTIVFANPDDAFHFRMRW